MQTITRGLRADPRSQSYPGGSELRRLIPLWVSACAALAGCGTIVPNQPNFSSTLILPKTADASGQAVYTAPQYTSEVNQLEPKSCVNFDADASPTPAERNSCIGELMQDIDDAYDHYEITVSNNVGAENLTFDAINTIASAAATATTGGTAKILSAIATVSNGGKGILSEDILYKDTIPTLISTMRADRAKDAARIKLSTRLSLTAYPMYQAKSDLLQYLYDGTLTNALVQAQQNASATAQQCQAVKTAAVAAVQSGGGAVTKPATTTANVAAATTTSQQCSQIADSITFKFDASPTATALLNLIAPRGVVDSAAVSAVTSCLKTLPAPAGFKISDYTLSDGSFELGSLSGDPSVDATFKAQILACAKAAMAKG